MTHETAEALAELSRRLFETEQKLDNYFKELHDQNAAKLDIIATAADDQTALRGKDLYPWFDEIKETYQHKGTRCRYEVAGVVGLYKFLPEDVTEKGTLIVENWLPTEQTVWEPIDEAHEGTLKDPIPARAGMTYEYGKYYIEGETIYLCTRQGGKEGDTYPLDHLPSQLVGHYFEIVQV